MANETALTGTATPSTSTPPATAPAPTLQPGQAPPAAPATTPAAPSKDSTPAPAGDGKTKDQGGQQTPPAEGAKEAAPAELEVKLPEGLEADSGLLDAFKAKAKELGLKSEGAQAIVDLYAEAQTKAVQRMEEAAAQRSAQWAEAVKADKELGGTNFEASLVHARKAVQAFGGDALKAVIDELGIGNHPELLRAFARVGKAMAEDSSALSRPDGAPARSENDKLRAMYPSMFPKE